MSLLKVPNSSLDWFGGCAVLPGGWILSFLECYRFVAIIRKCDECRAKMEVDIPASVAYKCYSDREAIPKWMPFISSVKVLEDNPTLSRWSLKYNAFGQDIEFSWLARNLQPTLNQKIHWRSLEGLPNRGVVRFYPKSPSSCLVELTVSYEVPPLLSPVASVSIPALASIPSIARNQSLNSLIVGGAF